MILFYAITGTQILNMLNLKVNQYANTDADLYIKKSPNLPLNMIDMAKKSNIFRHLVMVDSYSSAILSSQHLSKKIVNIFTIGLNKKRYYQNLILKNSGTIDYDMVVTYGYWEDSIYIVMALFQRNPLLKVKLIEEGVGSINSSFEVLTDHLLISNQKMLGKLLWKIEWFIATGKYFPNGLKKYSNLIDELFVYIPEFSKLANSDVSVSKLLSFNSENSLTPKLFEVGNSVDFSELERRRVIMFLYSEGLVDNMAYSCFNHEILPMFFEKWSSSDIVFKAHPALVLDDSHYHEKYPGIYIDNRKYPLEAIYLRLNLNSKVLVTRVSSAVYTPKYMFDGEPYVILTDFLYPSEMRLTKNKDDLIKLVSDLKSKYRHPEKVMLPNNIDELKIYLAEI